MSRRPRILSKTASPARSRKSTSGSRGPMSARGCLQFCTINTCSHTRRDARQRAFLELHKSDTRVTLSPDHTIGLEVRDLKRAISKLPEEQQSVILLVGLKGMAYAQAAAVVNASVGTVRSRVARGRETLRVMTELFPPRHPRRPCKAAPDPQRRPAPHSSSN